MKHVTGVFVAGLLAVSSTASAQNAQEVLPLTTDDIEEYRDWNDWAIFKNNTRGHCLGTKADDSGVIQFGITADETMAYIGVFVKEDVTPKDSNDVVILVGDHTYVGETSGPVAGLGDGWHGGYVLTNNPDFRKDVEKNDTLIAFPDQPYAVELDIKGANNGIYEIRKCSQELMN